MNYIGIVTEFDVDTRTGLVRFNSRRESVPLCVPRDAEVSVGDRIEVSDLPPDGGVLRISAQRVRVS